MIKEITPDQVSPDMKKAFDNWLAYFTESINAMGFNPFKGYQGEDKNLLAWRSKEEFISWYGQPPGSEPYRDDGFYVRELTWLSLWCHPKRVLEIGTDKDHVHFLVQSLPSYSPTNIIQTIKSITAREIFARHPEVKKKLWGGQFWSDGYN